MKIRLLFLRLFSLFLFFSFALPQLAFADTVTLSGSVKNSSGLAISGATVTVNDANNDSTTTDSFGNYSIIIPSGIYNVQVTPPSGSEFTSAIALNQNISTDTTLDFSLTPAGTIVLSGRVFDPLGNPVANQKVALNNSTNTNNFLASAVTDASGSYSLQIASGTYYLMVLAPQAFNSLAVNIPQSYQIIIGNYSLTQSTIVDITIPAKKVDIHVQDASGNPVSNVGITTNPLNLFGGNITLGGTNYSALVASFYANYGNPIPTTDASGNVTLWLLPYSNYSFIATPLSGGNFAITTVSNIAISNDTQKTIIIEPKLTLSGRVLDPLGNPVANQKVALNTSTSTNNPLVSSTTDSSGNYSLQIAAGTYYLMVLAPQSYNPLAINLPQTYQIIVSNYSLNQNTTLDITIPAKKVDIHVQDASGNPVSNVGITTNPRNLVGGSITLGGTAYTTLQAAFYEGNGSPVPTTDESGNVTLWLLPYNNYSFTATPPNGGSFATTIVSNIAVTNDTQKTIIMQQQLTLSGRVLDPLGNPVANQKVALNTSTGTNNFLASAVTDASGNYNLTASAGTYYLMILAPQSFNALSLNLPQSYQIIANNYSFTQNTSLDITIPAKKVDIHVQDTSGNPVSNVGITTSPQNLFGGDITLGGTNYSALVASFYANFGNPIPTTDSSGNVTLWLLPYSNYSFTATPPNGGIYNTFVLNNRSVTGNKTEIISLQYNHDAPITTATLETEHADGTYSNPTTVTLSATAASGYTVANTYYKVDGGTQQSYTAPFTVSGNGNHTITYWSVDNSGVQEAHKTKTFTIYTNHAPIVDPFPGATITKGQTFTATSSFTDPDSSSWTATVDYDDGAGPVELPLNPDKTFSLSHKYTSEGQFRVKVVVTDNQQATGTTWADVTVINRPPVLEPIGDKTVGEGQSLQFTVTANDPDGDNLTYSAANLPDGANFNPLTHIFSWTPAFNQAGNYPNIEFTVTDNGNPIELATELITITVGNVNRAPVIDQIDPKEVLENHLLTFTVSATDPDGDGITLSAINPPSGASFNPQTGVFSWTPTLSQADNYVVTFRATDDGSPVEIGEKDISITVGENPTPVEQADNLVTKVISYDFPKNIENSYLANLKKVGKFIQDGKIDAAINQLNAFISKVNTDYASGIITQPVRDDLIGLANALLADLQ